MKFHVTLNVSTDVEASGPDEAKAAMTFLADSFNAFLQFVPPEHRPMLTLRAEPVET